MLCPRCKTPALSPERYEGVTIDRCSTCKGVWLDKGELHKIVSVQEETFTDDIIDETLDNVFQGVPVEEQNHDLSCPKCGVAMKPVNYLIESGIIIDRCAQHGVWLDGKELEKVQVMKEKLDQEYKENKAEWIALAQNAKVSSAASRGQYDEGVIKKSGRFLINSIGRLFG